jgi:hypothetical protein
MPSLSHNALSDCQYPLSMYIVLTNGINPLHVGDLAVSSNISL